MLYWLPWWWYQWPRGWAFLPHDTGKNACQNFSFKGANIFLYLYNDHKTIFAHNRGDMYCIKSHIHFQVSSSTSEIFNKNLKIRRFYPGLPYSPISDFGQKSYNLGIFGSTCCFWRSVAHFSMWPMFCTFWPQYSKTTQNVEKSNFTYLCVMETAFERFWPKITIMTLLGNLQIFKITPT